MKIEQDVAVISRKNLWLHYSWPDDFARFAFTEVNETTVFQYAIYRGVVFLYFFAWLVDIGIGMGKNSDYFFIYLSNWTFVLQSVYNLLALGVAIERYLWFEKRGRLQPDQWQTNSTWRELLLWYTHSTASLAAIQVDVLFWMFEYRGGGMSAGNLHMHTFNGLIFIVDVFISEHDFVAFPCRLFHFWIPTVYSCLYVTFSGIYYAAGGINKDGGSYIYKALNYDENHRAKSIMLGVGLVIFGTPVGHCIMFALYRLKLTCYANLKRSNEELPVAQCDVAETSPVDDKVSV